MLLDFHSEIYSWIRGGLFILFLYHFLIFFQNKNRLYLYYSLYLLAITTYFLLDLVTEDTKSVLKFLSFPIQFLAFAAYFALSRYLFDLKNHLINWDKYFSIAIKVLLILAPLFAVTGYYFGNVFQVRIFKMVAPGLIIFTFYSYFMVVRKIEDKYSIYFVIASLIYIFLGIFSFSELFIGRDYYINRGVQPMFFVYLGAFIQSIIFSVIIGIIIKRIQQKSKDAEIRLAVKLKEMEELKMTALQSQMNPHFLFNSLNSINNFVIKSEVEKASDYITKFSKLIRAILNSSSSPTSTLFEELGILALYVKLEQMRVTGGFDFIVETDENLDLDKIKVPSLFLQPFIENAIWHGIMKKEGDKEIRLTITQKEGSVLCEVLDNGIGYKKTQEVTNLSVKRKFYGAEATESRIKMLYKNTDVHIETNDISTPEQTGTLVTIKFPLVYSSKPNYIK